MTISQMRQTAIRLILSMHQARLAHYLYAGRRFAANKSFFSRYHCDRHKADLNKHAMEL